MKQKVLVVDDDERLRDIMREYLGLGDYDVYEANHGLEAMNLMEKHDFSMVILDVMMPKMDGWSTCREIRKSSKVPIIMLTARGEEYDKLFGFELGVDDYMVKPFSPKELLARVNAIIRRSTLTESRKNEEKLQLPGLSIEFDSRNVYVDNSLISLTPKEYDLLCYFVRNINKALSREQLLNGVWGYDYMGDDRTVDTHVKMLRDSLMEYRKYIVTVWGIGYKFEIGGKK